MRDLECYDDERQQKIFVSIVVSQAQVLDNVDYNMILLRLENETCPHLRKAEVSSSE